MNDRLQFPYIAALCQPLAVACSEYPWGPVECLLAVFVLAALLRIAPSPVGSGGGGGSARFHAAKI